MGRVVIIACTNVGRAMIDAIYNSDKLQNVELVGVVNLKPENAVDKANYDSYTDLKIKYRINIYYCENVNEDSCVDFLENCKPDIIIQSGWFQKFSQKILNIPKYACIGEHPAPLPRGRGAACVNWAIITGEKEWGDTFFKMEIEYDTGLIYSQEFFNIELYDDVKTVYDKVARAAVNAIEKNLEKWTEGQLEGIKQDDSIATHYSRRRPSDGEFDFSWESVRIYNHIRGQAKPYPGAYFLKEMDGQKKKIYVWKAAIDNMEHEGGVRVLCGDNKDIVLLRLQIEGMTEMWAKDFYDALYYGHKK